MEYADIECLQPFHCLRCNRSWDNFSHYQLHKLRHKYRHHRPISRSNWLRRYTRSDLTNSVSHHHVRTASFLKEFIRSCSFVDIADGVKCLKYRCLVCARICLSASGFKHHCKVHTEYHWFQTVHLSNNCKNGRWQKKFADRRKPSIHVCPHCGRDLFYKDSLRRHTRLHLARERVTDCLYCKVRFDHANELKKHMNIYHGQNPLIKYKTVIEVTKQHECNGVVENRKFKCEICGKQSRDNTDLKRHVARNHSAMPPSHECQICGKIYKNHADLKRHMARNHSNGITKHSKMKTLQLKDRDSSHVPSSSKLIKCEHCSEEFVSKSDLVHHSVVHTNDRPHPCSYCELRYKRVGDRNRHERSHTGVHLVTCRFCGRGSRDMATLKKHEVTHTKKKVNEEN